MVNSNECVGALTASTFFSSQLPKKEELKSVVDKVKDFFGEVTSGAKESFAQITGTASTAEAEAQAEDEKPRFKRRSKKKGKQQKPKQGFSK
jgi:uncharacterized membrane protein YukC